MEALKRILVPVDGSEYSDKAARWAAHLAAYCESTVDLLYVSYFDGDTDSQVEAISWLPETISGSVTKRSQAILEHTMSLIAGETKVETHVETGIPSETILKFAERADCGLIVVGGRGLGLVEGFLLGSVSRHLTERAKCPVLVVK